MVCCPFCYDMCRLSCSVIALAFREWKELLMFYFFTNKKQVVAGFILNVGKRWWRRRIDVVSCGFISTLQVERSDYDKSALVFNSGNE